MQNERILKNTARQNIDKNTLNEIRRESNEKINEEDLMNEKLLKRNRKHLNHAKNTHFAKLPLKEAVE